jgi:isopenicillin N synthase-like dioxygenase
MALVIVEYKDLCSGADLTEQVTEAYGPGGLGVIAVRGVPNFVDEYRSVLSQAHGLAHLSEEAKAELEDEKSLYNAGWSFGKEKLGDTPDTSKGSFYFNPLNDTPGTVLTDEQNDKWPFFLPPNRWPASLPDLKPACQKLGTTVHAVTGLLAKQVDALAAKKLTTYPRDECGLLGETMGSTIKCKGRLLYYFPIKEKRQKGKEDGWIGWHNDSGFLTALTPDMYLDESGNEIECPDPGAGLWVVDRDGGTIKVDVPKDCLAIQCGECLQVITGGLLTATPHCVRPCRVDYPVARTSCPFFIDTQPEFPLFMPAGCTRTQVVDAAVDTGKVPPLESRWEDDGQSFVEFLGSTFRRYYEHATKGKTREAAPATTPKKPAKKPAMKSAKKSAKKPAMNSTKKPAKSTTVKTTIAKTTSAKASAKSTAKASTTKKTTK